MRISMIVSINGPNKADCLLVSDRVTFYLLSYVTLLLLNKKDSFEAGTTLLRPYRPTEE